MLVAPRDAGGLRRRSSGRAAAAGDAKRDGCCDAEDDACAQAAIGGMTSSGHPLIESAGR